MLWLAMLLLSAAVALFVAAPLTEAFTAGRHRETAHALLAHEHRLAIAALRELDFDHAMGKIADAEFSMLRGKLEVRALTAMAALERSRAPGSAATDHAAAAPR